MNFSRLTIQGQMTLVGRRPGLAHGSPMEHAIEKHSALLMP